MSRTWLQTFLVRQEKDVATNEWKQNRATRGGKCWTSSTEQYKQLPLQSVLPGFVKREFVYDFAIRHNSHNDAKRFDGDLWGSLWQQIKQKQQKHAQIAMQCHLHRVCCTTFWLGEFGLLTTVCPSHPKMSLHTYDEIVDSVDLNFIGGHYHTLTDCYLFIHFSPGWAQSLAVYFHLHS